jgi:hypothetical protein
MNHLDEITARAMIAHLNESRQWEVEQIFRGWWRVTDRLRKPMPHDHVVCEAFPTLTLAMEFIQYQAMSVALRESGVLVRVAA